MVVSPFVCIFVLSLVWGIGYALLLTLWDLAHYLADRRPWITVIAGVAVQVLILRIPGSCTEWWWLYPCFAASGGPLVLRSLILEYHEEQQLRENMHG